MPGQRKRDSICVPFLFFFCLLSRKERKQKIPPQSGVQALYWIDREWLSVTVFRSFLFAHASRIVLAQRV